MKLDERFLTVHPRTVQWWKQREQCNRCVNSHGRGDETHGMRKGVIRAVGMRCSAVHVDAAKRVRPDMDAYCIDARAEGGLCGPEAKLFREAA